MSDTPEPSKEEALLVFLDKYTKHYDKALPHYSGMLRTAMDLKLAKLRRKATQLIRKALNLLDVGSGFYGIFGLAYCREGIPKTKGYTCRLDLTDKVQQPAERLAYTWTIQVFDANDPTEYPSKGFVFQTDLGERARLVSTTGSVTDAEVNDARFVPLLNDVTTLHDLTVQLTRIHSAEKAVELAGDVVTTFSKHMEQVLGNDLAKELEKYGIPGYDFWNHSS